jgi:uncharacterized protein YjbI with pentapeptide repeats
VGVAPGRTTLKVLGILLVIVAAVSGPASAAAQPPPTGNPAATRAELENDKLSEEIRKLELENDNQDSKREKVLAFAPFVTALVAVVGVVLPIWTLSRERNRQLELDRQQRERELEQQRIESQRRFDEQFAKAVENLGSDNEAVQTGAAVSLASFLRPEYGIFHEQVFRLLCANLRLQQAEGPGRLLLEGFEQAIRLHLEAAAARGERPTVDLARCVLERVDLSDLQLGGVDIAFANLRDANLTGANLERARGIDADLEGARLSRANLKEARLHGAKCRGAQFHEATLVSAELRNADLREAEFHRASMQSAHLDDANLEGAKFEQADVRDTFFRRAILDDVARRSLVRAKGWREAHYDPGVLEQIELLVKGSKPRD